MKGLKVFKHECYSLPSLAKTNQWKNKVPFDSVYNGHLRADEICQVSNLTDKYWACVCVCICLSKRVRGPHGQYDISSVIMFPSPQSYNAATMILV